MGYSLGYTCSPTLPYPIPIVLTYPSSLLRLGRYFVLPCPFGSFTTFDKIRWVLRKMGRMFGPLAHRATLPEFDIEMSRNEVYQALDYVGERLSRKAHHLTLIVTGGEALSCLDLKTTNHCSNISIVPASPLSPAQMTHLATSAKKAAKKFNLGTDWLNKRNQGRLEKMGYMSDLVVNSLLQNDVIHSTEGLTLLSADYNYALKIKLEELSMLGRSPTPSVASIDDAVALLHRLVHRSRGRTITKGYLRLCYPRLEMSDAALLQVGSTYEWKYGQRGISGVNDEWLEWRREGRIDMDLDFMSWGISLADDKSSILTAGEDDDMGIIPIGVLPEDEGGGGKEVRGDSGQDPSKSSPYAIDYGYREIHSGPSTRACSPRSLANPDSPVPKSATGKVELEQFLQAYNSQSPIMPPTSRPWMK